MSIYSSRLKYFKSRLILENIKFEFWAFQALVITCRRPKTYLQSLLYAFILP